MSFHLLNKHTCTIHSLKYKPVYGTFIYQTRPQTLWTGVFSHHDVIHVVSSLSAIKIIDMTCTAEEVNIPFVDNPPFQIAMKHQLTFLSTDVLHYLFEFTLWPTLLAWVVVCKRFRSLPPFCPFFFLELFV